MKDKHIETLMYCILIFAVLDVAYFIGVHMAHKSEPLEKEDYQMFKAVKIPEDTVVYVDPITIGKTTDPDY
jgi:hypothetical protein